MSKCNFKNAITLLTRLRERRNFIGNVAYDADLSARHFHNPVFQDGLIHLLGDEGILDQVRAEDWYGDVVEKRNKSANTIVKLMVS